MTTPSAPTPSSKRIRHRMHPARLLFLLPFVAMLAVPFYNRIEPSLGGVPFFYWYQTAWVFITAILAAIVYRAEHKADY
ncbi:Hypothetical protein GbCGDNIH9_2052 [Granulibacter bethesdensis]|uniref:DUF3311 domain-containing protein n=1 Tax=Granulibacter bethesdensis TaxID=364410 RepID=A0AAC9P9J4_9PROT|nr:DUF3311 domain-containing protein [Granulibacter bethesdensis]APH55370.1 Hypothetical protein GbCGDNIH9_2052 [Granulibacter bethesdensis]APH62956.1 Hypothetical protein GbCGDNIH8_2052 [Granulibacter bethesdensis]